MTTIRKYDIIVIGGGHAGCEAAAASAKLGLHTLLITSDMSRIAALSCNPAMGGIAKGQIVREIDALGGMTGILSDKATLQFRMLNRSKGPAMWSPRAQLDKDYFSILWRNELTHTDSLEIIQDTVRNRSNRPMGGNTSIAYNPFGRYVSSRDYALRSRAIPGRKDWRTTGQCTDRAAL